MQMPVSDAGFQSKNLINIAYNTHMAPPPNKKGFFKPAEKLVETMKESYESIPSAHRLQQN